MSLRQKNFIFVFILAACAAYAGWRLFAPEAGGTITAPFRRVALQEDVTPLATPTDLPPTPTETLLPAPELPTPESATPLTLAWAGAPTYLESQPGYDFRLEYEDALWALTEDETGQPALLHRQLPYCKIAPTGGRGLLRGGSVESEFREIGPYLFEVVTVSQDGVVQFVNYFGGDGVVLTGFQVSFREQVDECLQAAETVLATLSFTLAPTPTPEP